MSILEINHDELNDNFGVKITLDIYSKSKFSSFKMKMPKRLLVFYATR